MDKSMRYRCLAAVAAAGLGVVSAKSALGGVVAGPVQDFLTPPSSTAINTTISIHSELWYLTDDITIVWATANAHAAGVGYVETTADPNRDVVTTIYGDDLNPGGALSIGGLSATTPDFSINGGDTGETIQGTDGLSYTSYLRESPTKASLLLEYPDLAPYLGGTDSSATYFEYKTSVAASGVPEPASLALLAGGAGLLALRRRRRA